MCVCVCVRVTVVTGSLGHDADGPLLLAGGPPQEALVLVGVSVRGAHREELLVALKDGTRTCSLARTAKQPKGFGQAH